MAEYATNSQGIDTTQQYASELGVDPGLLDQEFPGTADAYLKFGKLIPNWEDLAPLLGLSDQEIFSIKSNPSPNMHPRDTLKKWKSKKGFKAKYGELVKAYLDLEDNAVADNICFAVLQKYCTAMLKPSRKSPVPAQQMGPVPNPAQHNVMGPIPNSAQQMGPVPDSTQQMKYVYCCTKVESKDALPNVSDVAYGSIRPSRIWDKELLKVFFMNRDVLVKDHWTFDGKPLTTTIILAWAIYWNSHAKHYPKIQITEASSADEAEIRVWFNPPNDISNYSKVGADASQELKSKHTMVLNLNVNGMTDKAKRSMVLHEFGHALGLEHEHQRSDFWEVLGKEENGVKKFIIGESEMRKQGAVSEHFKEDAPTLNEVFHRSDYDSESIMHYWFDVEWLLPKYRDRKNIDDDPDLTPTEKRVLYGVHDRHYDNGQLAEDPSELDYKVLNKAYRPKCHVDESPDKFPSFISSLKLEGVPDRDLQVLESEGFSTVQAFKLLKESDFKELNLTRAGKWLIPQLLEELSKGAGPAPQAPPPSSRPPPPTAGPGTSEVLSSSDLRMLNPGADPENGE